MKKFLLFLLFLTSLFSKELLPNKVLDVKGGITDLVLKDTFLYSSTTNGNVEVFDIKNFKSISNITIPKIKDFIGDEVTSKIYSIDIIDKSLLILAQGEKGAREVFLVKNNKLEKIISAKKRLYIAKAKFINKQNIIFSTLSNQLFLYSLKEKRVLYKVQISHSKFSDFSLNNSRDKIALSDESGYLYIYDTNSLKHKKVFKDYNLDNVFQVNWQKDKIITAGQDRKSVLHNLSNNNIYTKKSKFLIYSTALSPKAKLAAFSKDEENNILIFDIDTKKELFILKGINMLPSKILFLNEKEVFIGSDDKKINYYILKD